MLEFIRNFDITIINFINNHIQNQPLNEFMSYITKLGNIGIIWISLFLILLLMPKHRKTALMLLFALLLGTLLSEVILKPLISRSRPFIDSPYLHIFITKPTSFSFPSGHTTASFAAVGVIYQMIKNKLVKTLIILLAILISLSRLILMVHYPSDVLIGIILGLTCAKIVIYLFQNRLIKQS